MTVTTTQYGTFIDHLAQKKIDLDTDTLKVMLCTSSYTPDLDAHDYKNDITNEVSATGYTAAGASLASVTWTYNSSTNTWTLDAADTSWTITGSLTARYAVIYDSTPATDATRPLIALVDFGADQTATDGTFKLTWNASGILTIT